MVFTRPGFPASRSARRRARNDFPTPGGPWRMAFRFLFIGCVRPQAQRVVWTHPLSPRPRFRIVEFLITAAARKCPIVVELDPKVAKIAPALFCASNNGVNLLSVVSCIVPHNLTSRPRASWLPGRHVSRAPCMAFAEVPPTRRRRCRNRRWSSRWGY